MNYSDLGGDLVTDLRGNLHANLRGTPQDIPQVALQDRREALLSFCSAPKTRNEMQQFMGLSDREYFRKGILKPLLESGQLRMTIPDKPKSKNQKYVKV